MPKITTGFATLIESRQQIQAVQLMLDSLRSFGGVSANCPIWVFDGINSQQNEYLVPEGGEIFPVVVPPATQNYIFSAKVAACAQAEAQAAGWLSSLVWIDPECLVLKPPVLFELGPEYDAAVRPVHIKNIGLLHSEPLDNYWEGIYRLAGVPEPVMSVESFVDRQTIRAYFNSHAFSVNPGLGLLQRWAGQFESLVKDEAFQQSSCRDRLHQIFLFQAVLSALLVSCVDNSRIRILPTTYNYPYNLHQQVPPELRAGSFSDLTTLVWEGRKLAPDLVSDIAIEEPLRSWLASHDLPA